MTLSDARLERPPAIGTIGQPKRTWPNTHGTYLAGRAYIDEADHTAAQMEAKWGADRLRLLVGPELRERFDRQRYLFNQALWHGDLEAVRRESMRMVRGWLALDKAATAAGAARLHPQVMEVALADGVVAAIVPDAEHAACVRAEGRNVRVYTLDEIARLLAAFPQVAEVKLHWPGATVTAARRSVSDPLDSIDDTEADLDDPLPF